MERVNRYDRAPLASTLRTPEGFLRVDGSKIARTGIQIYRRADGREFRELREPSQVFDDNSMRSFSLLPLTNNHPSKMLDSGNAKVHAVGAVGAASKMDDKWITASISVWDADTIKSIEAGRAQLSAGYSCEVDDTPGEHPEFGKYDGRQTNILANHLAVVDVARAGPEARLRLDASDAEAVEFVNPSNPVVGSTPLLDALNQETPTMAHQLKFDGLQFEVNDANAQAHIDRVLATAKAAGEQAVKLVQDKLDAERVAVSSLQAKYDAREAQIKADAEGMVKCMECGGTGKVDGADCKNCDGKGEYAKKTDSAEKRKDSLERMVSRGVEKKTAQVNARAALVVEARKHLGANEKLDESVSDLAIKKLVIGKLDRDYKVDGKSEIELGFRYQFAIDAAAKQAPRPIDLARKAATEPVAQKTDDVKLDGEAGRQAFDERQRQRAAKK